VLWSPDGVEVRLTFQAVSDPLRFSAVNKRGELLPVIKQPTFKLSALQIGPSRLSLAAKCTEHVPLQHQAS
jgi:hypothetical protein